MSRSSNSRAFFAVAALAAAISLSAVPAGAASHRVAGGAPAASAQPTQIIVADNHPNSWFLPWYIHHWPYFGRTHVG